MSKLSDIENLKDTFQEQYTDRLDVYDDILLPADMELIVRCVICNPEITGKLIKGFYIRIKYNTTHISEKLHIVLDHINNYDVLDYKLGFRLAFGLGKKIQNYLHDWYGDSVKMFDDKTIPIDDISIQDYAFIKL